MTQDELDELDTTVFVEHFQKFMLVTVWQNDGKLKQFNVSERVTYL